MPDFFEEAKRYVGWSADDVARLRALEPLLRPHFPAFAAHFYEVIDEHPRAMAVLSGGPEQIERLRSSLVDWMGSGLHGPHDERFYDKRSRIGRRHVVIGLPQEYMFTAMNVLRLDYHATLLTLTTDTVELHASIASVDKLFDLELAIMLRHYQTFSEEKLMQRERAVQADRLTAMQTLTAGLAHEVRNPLNAAKLQLELLERRLRRADDDDRLLQTTGLVRHEIERLTRLLNEFLAFARPPQLVTGMHDLVAIVREVIDHERVVGESRGVSLRYVGDGVPVTADVDASKIHQIVLNLVRNAIEASPRDAHVEVALAIASAGAQITVSDQGAGIPDDVRGRIFEPFFSTKPEGTGMGMAIVHSLVFVHGGSIAVQTAPGRGSTFTVTLPRTHR